MRSRGQKKPKEDPFILGHQKSWWERQTIGEGNGRRYSEKFRKAAVKAIYLRGDKSLRWVCEQLGISSGMYWIWRREFHENPLAEGREVSKRRRSTKRGVDKLLGELV